MKKLSPNTLTQNNYGYSLMEIMVVLAIIGMMGLGTSTLITNMLKLNQKNEMSSGMSNFKSNLQTYLKNENSWENTIKSGNNPQLNCLWDGDNIQCPDGLNINNVVVMEGEPAPNPNNAPPIAGGNIYYNSGVATSGFNIRGAPCNTFDAAVGNDNCPFHYDLQITFDCPGGDNQCLKPKVTINATFMVRPATDTSLANKVVPTDYDFVIEKSDSVIYEPLEVVYNLTTDVPNDGTGNCNPGSVKTRLLNTVNYDVGNNVTGLNPAGVTLKSGIYECEVFAMAYEALDGFKIYLSAAGNAVPIGTGFSGFGSSATVVGKTSLDLPVDTLIAVTHECQSSRSRYDMGIPVPNPVGAQIYGGGNSLTRLTCVRSR